MPMIFPSILLTFTLVGTVQTLTWDCYDQKCEGEGSFSGTYIYCNNSINICSTAWTNYPTCAYSYHGGDGIDCSGNYTCSYSSTSGKAYCSSTSRISAATGSIGGGVTSLLILVGCWYYCCRRRRRRIRTTANVNQTNVVIQQTADAPAPQPIIQNINVVQQSQQPPAQPQFANPGYPPQPSYPPQPQPGYPAQPQPRYPLQPQPGYPPQPQPGYPAQPQPGYPAQPQPGYPAQPQHGYPAQPQPGYPAQPQHGYPTSPRPGYAAQPQPGFSPQPQPVNGSAPPPYNPHITG